MSATTESEPVVDFAIHADTGDRCVTLTGMIVDGRYRAYLDDDGVASEPLEGRATALPLRLAELVELGPRSEPAANAAVLTADALVGDGRPGLVATWDEQQRAGTSLEGDDWLWWTAVVSWEVAGGEPQANVLSVIDGGERGLGVVLEAEGGLAVSPCTSTEVWAALCELLPRAVELA